VSVPRVSFVNNGGIDVAFLLYSLSPKSFIPHSRQEVPRKLEGIAQEYELFGEKNDLWSPRDGLPKFHFLCTSLVDNQASIFSDVNRKYGDLTEPFQVLVEKAKLAYSVDRQLEELGDLSSLWKESSSLIESAQEIARIRFRLSDYAVFVLLSLSGKFGMPCMVHDKYIFINAQEQQGEFIMDAVFHELLHQLLLGHRYSREGKFFVGHFLWQPRRAMMEEVVLPCLRMEICDDVEIRRKERERVLHLEQHLPFLEPFTPLFPKVLQDWEEEYMQSQSENLQDFIDKCTRKYLSPLKFMFLMRKMSSREIRV